MTCRLLFPTHGLAQCLGLVLTWFGGPLWAQSGPSIEPVLERAGKNIQSDYQRAIDQADSALLWCSSGTDSAKALKIQSSALLYSGHYVEAYQGFEAQYRIHLRLNDSVEASKSMNNMGLVYRTQGRNRRAMEHFFKALELRNRRDRTADNASILLNIAATYAIEEEHDKARDYYTQALRGFIAKGDSFSEHRLYLDLAGLELADGRLDTVEALLDRGNGFSERRGLISESARSFYIRGNFHLEQNQYERAENAYREALRRYEEIGNRAQSAGCLLRLSEVAQGRGRWNDALELGHQSLKGALEINALSIIARSEKQLSDVYAQKGEFAQAFAHRLSYEKYNDSVSNSASRSRIAELEEQYQSEQQSRKMAELLAENRQQELDLRKQQSRIGGLAALIGLGSLVSAGLLWSNRQRARNQKRLQVQNQIIERSLDDKETLLREVHHRVKNHLQLVSSLMSLQIRHLPEGESKQALIESEGRIRSLSLVHQSLYRSEAYTRVRVDEYLRGLVESLVHAFDQGDPETPHALNLEPISLDIEQAIPLGLIVNEWVTNAFKHGRNAQGVLELAVTMKRERGPQGDVLHVTVQDNGSGAMPGPAQTGTGFGLQLVDQLLEKLRATVSFDRSKGTLCRLSMPLETDSTA